jgi:hypothetical protein
MISRRLYVLFAIGAAVVIGSFLVAEYAVPDVNDESAARPDTTVAAGAGLDSTAAGRAAGRAAGGRAVVVRSPDAPGSGLAPTTWLAVGALIVAALSLGAVGGSVWSAVQSPGGDDAGAAGVRDAQMQALDRLTGALVPCLYAATRVGQLAQVRAQLGDEAPDGIDERLEEARATLDERYREVHAALTRGAVFLPNEVLDAVHDVDQALRVMASDDETMEQQGTQLAAQAMASYYTFAATARSWAGVGSLEMDRLLGLSSPPVEGETG